MQARGPAERGHAWRAFGALLILLALLGWWLPTGWIDWQPERVAHEPWRVLTAAFVHWSPAHLLANLAAAAVVLAYGWAAPVPRAATRAYAAAWPLTHLPLLAWPDLAHYGGLSGGLHAGVAVVSLWLLVRARGGRRAVGAAVMTGLVLKILSEDPLGPVLRHTPEWDIAIVPLAHATGALAGLLCAAVALGLTRSGPAQEEG